MDRREMLGVLSAGAATVVTFVGGAARAESVCTSMTDTSR